MDELENKQITIYDIAKEAGVSPSTVSRVLTNNANVRKEKKERILELIEKYNFKPNALARGLSEARSKVIGVIVADVRNPFYSQMFVACEHAAEKMGYTVFLADSHSSLEREIDEMKRLQNQKVDAILMIGGSIDQKEISKDFIDQVAMIARSTPFVTSSCVVDAPNCYAIRINESQCMKLLLEHLKELGHRDIAVVGGRLEVSSTWEKFEQFKKQMAEYEIPIREELMAVRGAYDFETGYQEIDKMLSSGNIPTAVIAINDAAALGVMQGIRDHGYRIPEDISVVGYDNTLYSTLANPTLTSIDYDYETYGERLIEIAIAAVEKNAKEKMQVVEPRLVVRKSTAPVLKIHKN